MFRRLAFAFPILAMALLLGLNAAIAQVPNAQPPFNTDLTTAVITNTLRTAGTVSVTINNVDKRGAICVLNETAHSGSPSTTISIDAFDAATNTWNTLVTSGIVSTGQAGGTQAPTGVIAVAPGVQTSSLPTGWVALNMVLPRTFRVTQVVAGSGNSPATTSKVGCNLVR